MSNQMTPNDKHISNTPTSKEMSETDDLIEMCNKKPFSAVARFVKSSEDKTTLAERLKIVFGWVSSKLNTTELKTLDDVERFQDFITAAEDLVGNTSTPEQSYKLFTEQLKIIATTEPTTWSETFQLYAKFNRAMNIAPKSTRNSEIYRALLMAAPQISEKTGFVSISNMCAKCLESPLSG